MNKDQAALLVILVAAVIIVGIVMTILSGGH